MISVLIIYDKMLNASLKYSYIEDNKNIVVLEYLIENKQGNHFNFNNFKFIWGYQPPTVLNERQDFSGHLFIKDSSYNYTRRVLCWLWIINLIYCCENNILNSCFQPDQLPVLFTRNKYLFIQYRKKDAGTTLEDLSSRYLQNLGLVTLLITLMENMTTLEKVLKKIVRISEADIILTENFYESYFSQYKTKDDDLPLRG